MLVLGLLARILVFVLPVFRVFWVKFCWSHTLVAWPPWQVEHVILCLQSHALWPFVKNRKNLMSFPRMCFFSGSGRSSEHFSMEPWLDLQSIQFSGTFFVLLWRTEWTEDVSFDLRGCRDLFCAFSLWLSFSRWLANSLFFKLSTSIDRKLNRRSSSVIRLHYYCSSSPDWCMTDGTVERDLVVKFSGICHTALPKRTCLQSSDVDDDLVVELAKNRQVIWTD